MSFSTFIYFWFTISKKNTIGLYVLLKKLGFT